MNKKVLLILVMILLISSTVAIAEKEDLSSLNSAIRSQRSIERIFKGESKDILMGMVKSFFDIARYAVIFYILMRLFAMYADFANAGDRPEVVASIKSKAMWHLLGLLFSLNFWSIFTFITRTASKFNFS